MQGKRGRFLGGLLLGVGMAAYAELAQAAIINVPGNQPTIQAGINAANPGDTVLVADGTYVENINLDSSITVRSVNGAASTVINGGGSRTVQIGDGIIDGFTITGGGGTDWNNGSGIGVEGSSFPTIKNCIVKENTAIGAGGGIFCDVNSSPTIANCIIVNNAVLNDEYGNNLGGGIYCNGDSVNITNCTIFENTASNGMGIYAGTCYACDGSTNFYSSVKVVNSIVWDRRPIISPIGVAEGSSVNISYSDVFGGWPGTGNINADPQLLEQFDPKAYHILNPESPCIDAGTDVGAPPDDIDGDARPQGAGYDMGADEYTATLALDITLNQSSFTTGQTLRATAHITNDATPDAVKVQVWVELPNGSQKTIRNIPSYNVPANANLTVTLFNYTFKGNEPAGTYLLGGRLSDSATGAVLSEAIEPFSFTR